MADVLLVSPFGTGQGSANFNAPALGVHRIAAHLRKHGHHVLVYDPVTCPDTLDEWFSAVRWNIIGFSLVHDSESSKTGVLGGTFRSIIRAKELCPDARLVAGGPEATEDFYNVLVNTPVDIVCMAEGEAAMLALANGESIEQIPGIIFRTPAKPITADEFTEYTEAIDWTELNWEEHWDEIAKLYDDPDMGKIKHVRLVPVSHCVRSCTYCSNSRIRTIACVGHLPKPVGLDAEANYRLLAKIREQIPTASGVYYCCDDILWNKKEFLRFCDIYLEKPLGFRFMVQTHSSRLDEATVKKLADIGTWHITVGVENCSERVRKSLKKSQDSQRLEDIITWCKKCGVNPYYLIILFCPEATMDDMWINHNKLTEWIEKDVGISIEPYMMPYRAAPIYTGDYEFKEQVIEVEGTDRKFRQPLLIWPKNPAVRKLQTEFMGRWPSFLEDEMSKLDHRHRFKGTTGKLMVKLLGKLLSGIDAR